MSTLAIFGVILGGTIAFFLAIYMTGYFFTAGKLAAVKIFFKDIVSDKEDKTLFSIGQIEAMKQMSMMRSYDQYYKIFGENKKEEQQ